MEYSQEMIKNIVAMVVNEMQSKANQFEPISIKPHNKKLLILISGGKLGANEVLEQIKLLYSDSYDMKALYTSAGQSVLGHKWICNPMPDIEIIQSDLIVSPSALLKGVDGVVIPILTFNTAAKVCCGIADNLVLSVIQHALLQGKPIIAAGDACNPNNPYLTGGKIKNPLYVNKLFDNIKNLKQYGMTIVDALNIRKTVNDVLIKNQDCNEFRNERIEPYKSNINSETSAVYKDRVLSASVVSQYKSNSLVISKNTLVTHAAKEIADKRGVSIIIES